MYIGLGREKHVSSDSLVGLFDLDITSQSYLTREFLSASEKAGKVINAADDIPKSFAVCREGSDVRVYLSQPSTATLVRRAENRTV